MRKSHIKYAITFLQLLMVIVTSMGVVVATNRESPTSGPLLRLNPSNPAATAGSNTTVELQLDTITDVYGAEVNISYDPAVLSVVGDVVTPGSCPQPDFIVANTASGGAINYTVTQLNPTPPCNGGVVASIEFECPADLRVRAETDVLISSSIISDPNGTPIPHDVQHAVFTCEVDKFFIEGSVKLQGWPDSSGVVVSLIDQTTGNPDLVTVGTDGAFQFQGKVNQLYDVVAEYDRYLSPLETGVTSSIVGATVDIGPVTMPAGDLNGDGRINILDIAMLAGNFGEKDTVPWAP